MLVYATHASELPCKKADSTCNHTDNRKIVKAVQSYTKAEKRIAEQFGNKD